jgi:hypothetical protein
MSLEVKSYDDLKEFVYVRRKELINLICALNLAIKVSLSVVRQSYKNILILGRIKKYSVLHTYILSLRIL